MHLDILGTQKLKDTEVECILDKSRAFSIDIRFFGSLSLFLFQDKSSQSQCTVVWNKQQESRRKYWATRSFTSLLAPLTRSLAPDCSFRSRPPLCSLVPSFARLLTSLTPSWENELLDGYFVCAFFPFSTIVQGGIEMIEGVEKFWGMEMICKM